MGKNSFPEPPREGIVYGDITSYLLYIGVIIAFIGLIIYLVSPGDLDKALLLHYLWQGSDTNTVWQDVGGISQPPTWYSCLGKLSKGDMLAMLGISISCFGAVLGMWGVVIQMVRNRRKLYLAFALIIAVVLTLSALGLVNLG
jgi:hypothetical protein